jgi:oxygen-dependent protoporphyrinogen oxidase
VVGAGIAGLAAAWEIRRAGEEVTVLDAAHRPGGMLQTFTEGGFTVDAGADSLRRTDRVATLLGALGLAGAIVPADPAIARRAMVVDGALAPLDAGALRSLFRPDAPPLPGETVERFAGRVAGRDGKRLADALVTGIYGGDPARLSAVHAFGPMLPAGQGAAASPPPPPVALKGGMSTLVQALARGSEIRTGTRATSLTMGGKFEVDTEEGVLHADRVVVALGPEGLRAVDRSAPAVAVAHVSVLGMGFPTDDLGGSRLTDSYGFLAPGTEDRFALGVQFTSSVFRHTAAEGMTLWRAFIGGARHPERAGLEKPQALAGVLADVEKVLGLRPDPNWVALLRHRRGIPQPELGHERILERRERLEREFRGLAFCGLGFEGVSADHALESGIAAVERARGT